MIKVEDLRQKGIYIIKNFTTERCAKIKVIELTQYSILFQNVDKPQDGNERLLIEFFKREYRILESVGN